MLLSGSKGIFLTFLLIIASLLIIQGALGQSYPLSGVAPTRAVITAADPAGRASPWAELLATPTRGSVDDPLLVQRGLVPIGHLPGGWTIAGLPDGGGDLENLVAKALPVPVEGEILLAISLNGDPKRRRLVSSLGPTVHLDGMWSVLLTRPDRLDEAASLGSVVQIFMRPILQAEDPRASGFRSPYPEVIWDPWIDGRVSSVSVDTLRSLAQTLQDFGTRHSNTIEGRRAGDLILDRFQSYGYDDVWLFDFNAWSDNVVARRVGILKPEEIVVIGGHYDSISREGVNAPGADDNASGTVGVMEAARVLAAGDFERTIIFIAFSGEEQGLVGSEAFAAWARRQGWNVVAMVNLDMIGYLVDEIDLDLIWRNEDQDLVRLVGEVVPLYVPDLPVVDGYLTSGSSDHASFWAQDYPAVFFFEDSDRYSPYIHTSRDVIGVSLNSFEFMKLCVQAATATVATLASPMSLKITHESLSENQDFLVPYPVEADISGPVDLDPESPSLIYQVNEGPFLRAPLEPLPHANLYGAEIPPQEAGTHVSYYLEASDTNGHLARDPQDAPMSLHRFRVGFVDLFADDFSSDLGWTTGEANDSATSGTWIRSRPVGTTYQPDDDHTPGEGGICWVTGNGPAGDDGAADVDGGRTTLLSPSIDVMDMQSLEISYWLWYVNEVRRDDTFRVEASSDGGSSWTTLLELSESLDGWTHMEHTGVEEMLGGAMYMRLRFVAEDVGLPSVVEALVDDVAIRAVSSRFPGIPDSLSPVAASGLRLRVWPNPATVNAQIALDLPGGREVSLALFNVSGQRVRTLAQGVVPGGRHVYSWGGRSDEGRRLPAGVYWLRLEQDGREHSERILLLR